MKNISFKSVWLFCLMGLVAVGCERPLFTCGSNYSRNAIDFSRTITLDDLVEYLGPCDDLIMDAAGTDVNVVGLPVIYSRNDSLDSVPFLMLAAFDTGIDSAMDASLVRVWFENYSANPFIDDLKDTLYNRYVCDMSLVEMEYHFGNRHVTFRDTICVKGRLTYISDCYYYAKEPGPLSGYHYRPLIKADARDIVVHPYRP